MRRNLFVILAISLSAISCTEKINLKLDESAQRIVVEGFITNETKTHSVKLTKSTGYFSNEPAPRVTGAIVSINDGAIIYNLHEKSPGIYLTDSNVTGIIGNTYTLVIKYDGETYSASSYLKYVPAVDSIFCKKMDLPFGMLSDSYEVDLWAQEPQPAGDYYMWTVYKNHILDTDTLKKVSFSDDSFINGNYAAGVQVQQVKVVPGDTVTLAMYSISKAYYDFLTGALTETGGGGSPFDGPPANIKGNISNGALGFFLATAVSTKSCIVQ
jgi:hypothetical protein